MRKGKLKCGFEYEIDESVLDNMELLDVIVEVDENPTGISKLVRMLLSDDQRKQLYDHLRTEKGNVPVMAVSEAITEILSGAGAEGKN